MTNAEIVNRFFECYSRRDFAALGDVLDTHVTWYFLGRHKLAGIKRGVSELVEFFDKMAGIMSQSKPSIDKLVAVERDQYFIECQHIKTNRPGGINIDHYVTVLWTIENGKIVSGRHFFADPAAVDRYFNSIEE
jgi:uncharacterized protein